MDFTKTQLYVQEWLQLSQEVRAYLAEKFELTKDVATEVCGNQVFCDGYSNEMLSKISAKKMNELGIEGKDFLDTFINMLKGIQAELKELAKKAPKEVVDTYQQERLKVIAEAIAKIEQTIRK